MRTYSYTGILLYIITIIYLAIAKPEFIYDNEAKEYKQFGILEHETLSTFPVVAILLALIYGIIFSKY